MHVAMIRRTTADRNCRIAVTGSDDKTVRLWSLPDGRLLRTLRLPISGGNYGKVFAAAVSPDGRYVAVGGQDALAETDDVNSATIFDTASGTVLTRVGRLEETINDLVWSADGRWLAATLNGQAGVRMIDTLAWRVVAGDKPYGAPSNGAVFAPDGRLYTTSYNGEIRQYGPGPGFTKEVKVTGRAGKLSYAIAITPDGKRLAVGYADSPAIEFYDAPWLTFRGHANPNPNNGSLFTLAWRNDGRTLIASGTYRASNSRSAVIFDRTGRQLGPPVALTQDSVIDLNACGGGFAVATADPAFGLLASGGGKRFWKDSVAADMRDKRRSAFTVSTDAHRVRFGLGLRDMQPVLFDLFAATLSDSPTMPTGLTVPLTEGSRVTAWENDTKPKFDGRPIALDPSETSRSLAERPTHDGFVLATDYDLRAFDGRGVERWKLPSPDVAWGVNFSADGRVVVAAYSDGTIRWHRWSDGQELLALFVNKQNRTWVAWTPSGYYMASPGGEGLIGWHVNRGWAQAADFFPASKFRDQFSRPDIVAKILDTLDEDEAVKLADAARGGKVAPVKPLLERLPPVISILSPAQGSSVGDDVQVDYLVRSPSNLPVDAVETLIDGRPPSGNRGLARVSKQDALTQCLVETRGLGRTDGVLQGCRSSVTVHLPPGAREIGLYVRSADKTSEVVRIRLVREAAARTAANGGEPSKPKLYALVVGISAYANADYTLTYPSKDARDFAAALANQKGGQYGDVEIRTLTDGQASSAAIKDGLDWLTKHVTNRDVGLVYLAGHGMLDERERFYFLAADSDAARLRATAVPRDDIADALDALPGKALLFLDACHAGAVALGRREALNVNTVVNDLADAEHGVTVFAASTGRQLSQENETWNNGAFTKAVVEGLGLPGNKAKADLVGTGSITTSELDAYVANRVRVLTSGEQSPVMIRPATVPDFPLAVAR